MFERFTDAARRVIVFAQEEARELSHDYIGTEHIWLGLLREGEGVAAKVLDSLGVSLESARGLVEEAVGRGRGPAAGHIPFTPEAKETLERSFYRAHELNHRHIGTEEILLGLLDCGGVGKQMMEASGVTEETVMPVLDGVLKDMRISAGRRTGRRVGTEEVEDGPILEPTCPVCRRALSETAATATMDVPGPAEGDLSISVSVVFCTACGSSIGLVP